MENYTKIPETTKFFHNIKKGDVVKTVNGLYAFDRIPSGAKNWYGKSMKNGKSYRIQIGIGAIGAEFKVVGHYDFPSISTKSAQNLSKDDLFVIKHGRGENAELFRFVRSTAKKIIAVNPLTNKTYNIDRSFTFTKIDNLPY